MRYSILDSQKDLILLFSRIILMVLFVTSGWGKLTHFSATVVYFTSIGAPLPEIATLVAIFMEFLVGLAIVGGYFTRPLSLLLAIFVVGTALIGHPFWQMPEPARSANLLQFYKNMSIFAGLLLLTLTGPGKFSLDRK